jgi:hypothetical protein
VSLGARVAPKRQAKQLKSFHRRRIRILLLSSNLLISGAGWAQLDKRTGALLLRVNLTQCDEAKLC